MIKRRRGMVLTVAAACCLLAAGIGDAARAAETVRLGQSTSILSFLSIYAARALGTFQQQGLDLEWSQITGGDANALAALDSGDIDLAAVGSDSALLAISKGGPYQFVYSLASRSTIELLGSNAFIKRAGLAPDAPLHDRILALRGATVGISAIGGAQDRMVRWLVAQEGLDPAKDLSIVQIGPPVALQAALENGRIDAFSLSPPAGFDVEKQHIGRVFIKFGEELPAMRGFPYLVLVAKVPMSDKVRRLTTATARVLQIASRATLADPEGVAAQIQRKFFPRIEPAGVESAVDSMKSAIGDDGRLTPEGIEKLYALGRIFGTLPPKDDSGKEAGKPIWTNEFVDAAAQADPGAK